MNQTLKPSIYLDNAASTPILPDVKQVMMNTLDIYGNPSSVHKQGREAKAMIERMRRNVATKLGVTPSQLFFTSGATESINTAIFCTLKSLPELKTIITSKLEHDAVIKCTEHASKFFQKELIYVKNNSDGYIDLEHFSELMKKHPRSLVALMHINNELGNITDIEQVGKQCQENGSIFLTDTVQSVAHLDMNMGSMPFHLACATSHKFHGPKGVGILIIKDIKICPHILGGGQEINMRAGTENLTGIAGFEKALEMSLDTLEKDSQFIKSLKVRMINNLKNGLQDKVGFYGDYENGLYTIVNVKLVAPIESEILIYGLDIDGVCMSSGSACSSGGSKSSHVIQALSQTKSEAECPNLRISFSKLNTEEEIDFSSNKIVELVHKYS